MISQSSARGLVADSTRLLEMRRVASETLTRLSKQDESSN